MTLYAIDPGAPPTYAELSAAIETYAHELLKRFAPNEVMPMDVPLLRLAKRLAAVRNAAQDAPGATLAPREVQT